MIRPKLPNNENERCQSLHEYQILDTEEELTYYDITSLAAKICKTPIALISLVDENRQWHKSRHGFAVVEIPRDLSFCSYAIEHKEIFIVEDAQQDVRFQTHPWVMGESRVRFYAGVPLCTPSGYYIGTLCVLDRSPRQLTTQQLEALKILSSQIISKLEIRKKLFLMNKDWTTNRTEESVLYGKPHETMKRFSVERNLRTANLAFINQKKALDASAIVAEADTKGHITYVNDKFVEISKYSREELIGHDHRVLNSGYHPKSFFQNMWISISKGDVWHGEIKNKSKDGGYYWVDSTVYPVKDLNNIITSYISIRFDITDKKEAFENLKMATEKAIAADRAKSDFLYTLSHEIRTPLNGIIGMTSLLQETRLSPEQEEFSQAIVYSGKTLLALINDILDFAKIEAGKMPLEEIEFNFSKYLEDLLKPFQYTAHQNKINFKFHCNAYDFCVIGDDAKIGRVISNLVSNALKFTKEGGVVVNVELKPDHDKTSIVISVQDTGIGIPKEAQGKIFEAFSQAEKSTSRNFGGTGLGLSISKLLVELMGGQISFESESDIGSTFTVKMSLKTGAQIKTEGPLKEMSVGGVNVNTLNGRILVAEDNTINQLVIARMLDKLGCKYLLVANGLEVIDAMKNANYDLILMDCQMPEMDGYSATQVIRNSEDLNSKIPIVAITANAVKGDEEKCYAAGMNGYLTKPIHKEALYLVLQKYLPSARPEENAPVIERSILNQLNDLQTSSGPDIFIELIDTFLQTTPQRIKKISDCIEGKDILGASREAHALKSSAQILGAKRLGELCQQLENSKDLQNVTILHIEIVNTHLQACQELRAIKIERELLKQKKVA